MRAVGEETRVSVITERPIIPSEAAEAVGADASFACAPERDVVYAERLEGGIEVVYLNQPRKKNALSGEMMTKLDALLRRMGENTPATHTGELYQPPFLLNLTNRTLEKNGERVKLTQIEYAIVKLFMENSGKALAREEILDAVWGKGYFGELKIVDVNVRRLRLKIEDDAQEPKYISTVWGFGYKWTV